MLKPALRAAPTLRGFLGEGDLDGEPCFTERFAGAYSESDESSRSRLVCFAELLPPGEYSEPESDSSRLGAIVGKWRCERVKRVRRWWTKLMKVRSGTLIQRVTERRRRVALRFITSQPRSPRQLIGGAEVAPDLHRRSPARVLHTS